MVCEKNTCSQGIEAGIEVREDKSAKIIRDV
jgi:hypothetical protein